MSVQLQLWEVPYCELLGGSSQHLGLLLRSADAILFVLDGGDDAGAEAVDDWRDVVSRRARAEGTEMVLMTHRADLLPTVQGTGLGEDEDEDENFARLGEGNGGGRGIGIGTGTRGVRGATGGTRSQGGGGIGSAPIVRQLAATATA